MNTTPAAKWSRDPELAMFAMSILHAVLGASFGFSLIYSAALGLDTVSPSYRFIASIPGWPWTVGTLYLALGIGQLWSGFTNRCGWSALFFGLASAAVGSYAALYVVGTITAPAKSIVGPQVTYLVLASLYGIHSAYSAARWLDGGE